MGCRSGRLLSRRSDGAILDDANQESVCEYGRRDVEPGAAAGWESERDHPIAEY